MVDALKEIWRTLVDAGTLLDLRPFSTTLQIEIVTAEGEVQIGEVDAHGAALDDVASDRAVREVVRRGLFVLRNQIEFGFELYWDTVAEMKAFMDGSRRMRQVSPSYTELDEIQREARSRVGEPVQFRCRRPVLLATYQKSLLPRS